MPSSTWTIYLLRCADGSLYAGITNDLAARISAHNEGRGAKYTRSRRPVELAWKKSRQPATAARRLEPRIKRLHRDAKLALIAGDETLWRAIRRAALGAPT